MQSIQKILKNANPGIHSARPVTRKNETKTMSSSLNNTEKADKRIDLLFSKFSAFYGHVWRSQFKDEVYLKFAKKEWQEALNDFSDVVFNRAIVQCRDFYELPPTLPQLLQCCRQIKKQITFYVVKESFAPASREVVDACLQECRAMLNQ